MSDPIGGGSIPQGEGGIVQSQNLFEHAASRAQALPEGAGPMQLGQHMLENLQGYVARTQTLAERSNPPAEGAPVQVALVSPGYGVVDPAAMTRLPVTPPPVAETQMDQAIGSLGVMFDYAIETQMVVRGTTQLAGAANTLLRGQ